MGDHASVHVRISRACPPSGARLLFRPMEHEIKGGVEEAPGIDLLTAPRPLSIFLRMIVFWLKILLATGAGLVMTALL